MNARNTGLAWRSGRIVGLDLENAEQGAQQRWHKEHQVHHGNVLRMPYHQRGDTWAKYDYYMRFYLRKEIRFNFVVIVLEN